MRWVLFTQAHRFVHNLGSRSVLRYTPIDNDFGVAQRPALLLLAGARARGQTTCF
jgi:hypothetical protein